MRSNNKGAAALLLLMGGCSSGDSYAPAPAYPTPPPALAGPAASSAPLPPPAPVAPPAAADVPQATSASAPGEARYDEVGYASWYGDELRGSRTASGSSFDPDAITAAHRSLPLGSFAEVTSLDSGRTILLQITDRGPHRAGRLIDLSLGAAKLLGVDRASIAPVRVREVVPPFPDQVALRSGQPASARIDSPPVLLAGLRSRLTGPAATIVTTKAPPPPVHLTPPAKQARVPIKSSLAPIATTPATHGLFVQVATFSSQGRASALARQIDGRVTPAGNLWRVRLGPFDTQASADRARDGVARRGYGDARVVRED